MVSSSQPVRYIRISYNFVLLIDIAQCRQRLLKCTNPNITKGRWTEEEDNMLRCIMERKSKTPWKQASNEMPGRTSKQCRERWNNYLCPEVNKNPFTEEEDRLLQHLYNTFGKSWAKISKVCPIFANFPIYLIKHSYFNYYDRICLVELRIKFVFELNICVHLVSPLSVYYISSYR